MRADSKGSAFWVGEWAAGAPTPGAVWRAKRANEKRENSFRSFPGIFVPTAFDGRGLRPLVRGQKSEGQMSESTELS